MRNLNELQQELDTIRKRIDPDDKYCQLFEIEPTIRSDTNRELKIENNNYHILKYERGKKTGTMVFESSDELIYYFTMDGIAMMIVHSKSGIGRMTPNRLKENHKAQLRLMEQTMPEWAPRYEEHLDIQLAKILEIRKKRNSIKPTL